MLDDRLGFIKTNWKIDWFCGFDWLCINPQLRMFDDKLGSLKKQIRRSTNFVGLIDFVGLTKYTFVHNQRHLMWWHIW
jgi:hypothetical protein